MVTPANYTFLKSCLYVESGGITCRLLFMKIRGCHPQKLRRGENTIVGLQVAKAFFKIKLSTFGGCGIDKQCPESTNMSGLVDSLCVGVHRANVIMEGSLSNLTVRGYLSLQKSCEQDMVCIT